MTETTSTNAGRARGRRLRTEVIGWLGIAWAAVVVAILAWQTFAYRGIISLLAEWQFRTFDRFFPILTIAVLTALLTLPFSFVILKRLLRSSEDSRAADAPVLLRRTSLVQRFLFAVMAISTLAAAILAGLGFASAGVSEREQILAIGGPGPRDYEGRAALKGELRLDRIGYYRERFLVTGRDLWVAPITPRAGADGIRYFVQVNSRQASASEPRTVRGYLRRSAIPGGLERLYRNAGYRIDRPTYVLFSTAASARWPFISAAGDMLIVALVAGAFWLIERRRRRKALRSTGVEGHIRG